MYSLHKVCLICPPSPFLLDERVFPFLGILKVASAWEAQGVEVDVLDLCGIENYLDVVDTYLKANAENLIFIGITATTPQLPNACQISEFIGDNYPEVLRILGGPHVTLMHTAKKREAKKGIQGRAHQDIHLLMRKFEYLVCGDGELTFERIMDNIRAGYSDQIVIDVDDRNSEQFLTDQKFSELPNPARHLIDLDSYKYYIDGERATSLISQLGCPFQCLVGSERVPTQNGLLKLEDIVNSNSLNPEAKQLELIVNSEKKIAKTAYGLNQGVHEVVKLVLKNGMSLTGHPEHRIRIVREGKLKWSQIKDVLSTDHAIIQVGSKIYPKEYVKLVYDGYLDKSINSGNFKANDEKVPEILDEDLAWIMGFLVGDGSFSDRGLTFAVINKTKDKLLQKVKKVFDYDCRVYKIKSTEVAEQAWIYSVKILDFFRRALDFQPENKHRVPESIYRSPLSVVKAFLEGLFDADGYSPSNGGEYLTTFSKNLAEEVVQLLVYVGICPSLLELKNKNRDVFYYRVVKSYWDVVPHKFGAYWNKKGEPKFRKSYAGKSGIRKNVLKQIDNNHELYDENWYFVPVREVFSLLASHKLYDLTVPETESYISSGFISHNCTFCSGRNSPFLRNIRNRTIDSVIAEMEHIYLTYGYKGMMLYDDELNVNKEMVPLMYAIADLGQKHGVQWKLRGFTKSELFTEEQAKAMYEAGFRILLTGFESGDPRILKNIRKRATRDDNTRCVEIAKKYNLKVKALMSIGHAGESFETIENTKKWLLEVEPDDFDCTVITTYPGSPYFDDAVWEGDKYVFTSKDSGDKLYQANLDYTKEVDYYKGIPGNYVSHVWTDYLSPEDLAKCRDDLEHDVRKKLKIPYNPANPAKKYEHSMGSSRNLPDWILRSTETHKSPQIHNQQEKVKLKVIE